MANFSRVSREGNNQRVEFKIEHFLGSIAHNQKTGWNKEVNIVKWNDGDSKLDIREWDPNHERMSKGITFNESEAGRLTAILSRTFPNDCVRRGSRESRPQMEEQESLDNSHDESCCASSEGGECMSSNESTENIESIAANDDDDIPFSDNTDDEQTGEMQHEESIAC